MAVFFYAIVFSPPAFGNCNEGNTFIDLVQINGRSQLANDVEEFRLANNSCVFFNDEGLEVGVAGTDIEVVIRAGVDTAAVGNRSISFFMCSGGREYNGPTESEGNDGEGRITLEAIYTVGQKVAGDCVSFLRSKIGAGAATEVAVSSPTLIPTSARSMVISRESRPLSPELSELSASSEPKKVRRSAKSTNAGKSEKERTKQIIKRITGQ